MVFEKLKCGDREVIRPIKIPEKTLCIIKALVEQNGRLLALNDEILRGLLTPAFIVSPPGPPGKEPPP